MRVVTINVNGLRSAYKKGLFTWLLEEQFDLIALQEIKAQENDLCDDHFHLPGYHRYLVCAEKKGYSGVAIYCKNPPLAVQRQLGFSLADSEGRYLAVDFPSFTFVSMYLPSGTSGELRQAQKYVFLEELALYFQEWCKRDQPVLICGDFNIAHREIDLKNWKQNQKNPGFLPEERAFMETLFGEWGFLDAFRELNPHKEQYTWWSNRRQAYQNNVGWRIDYQVASFHFKECLKSTYIYKNQRFSDHAPCVIEYDWQKF